jgi:dipeptidase D
VRARGTTPGADNIISCALSLGLLEDGRAAHGPLELLFTVNEEAGMDGTHGLQCDFMKGRLLINLDSEA